jgi:hypothetical protein
VKYKDIFFENNKYFISKNYWSEIHIDELVLSSVVSQKGRVNKDSAFFYK